jgi:hypothetical protein
MKCGYRRCKRRWCMRKIKWKGGTYYCKPYKLKKMIYIQIIIVGGVNPEPPTMIIITFSWEA